MRKVKTFYEFDPSAHLEVEYQPGKWARTTARHFRSWIGPRRVNGEEVDGLVFFEGTNIVYEPNETEPCRIVSIAELNDPKLRERYELETIEVVNRIPRRY